MCVGGGGGGGVHYKNSGAGVQHASGKPFPISDQTMRFSLPFLSRVVMTLS